MGHGGGIITWKYKGALLFALAMVIAIVPSVEGLQTQNTSNKGMKIDLNETFKHEMFEGAEIQGISSDMNHLEVNAASKIVKKHHYTKVKAASTSKNTTSTSSGVGAYNVVVTSKYVMATGKGSCSLDSDYSYHTRVFENYNPATHTWGTLNFRESSSFPEGQWYDVKTDMDFCLVHGKSHDNRGVYLIPYNGTINGKKVVNGYFV